MKRLESSHQQELDALTDARVGELEKLQIKSWLKGLRKLSWSDKAPEVEIEAKFVFPLLRYLGYEDKDMAMRVSVPMQEGSSKTIREADWVVWDENGNALVVVEAKAPNVSLGEAMAKQARSYAFRLGSPIYITTNGKEVQVFHRGAIDDRCVLSCTVGQLSEKWEAMQAAAGKSNVVALRNRLIGEE
jgi:type I site-specific restriction endonuclease